MSQIISAHCSDIVLKINAAKAQREFPRRYANVVVAPKLQIIHFPAYWLLQDMLNSIFFLKKRDFILYLGPINPGIHRHENPPTWSTHSPPFRQGDSAQSFSLFSQRSPINEKIK